MVMKHRPRWFDSAGMDAGAAYAQAYPTGVPQDVGRESIRPTIAIRKGGLSCYRDEYRL